MVQNLIETEESWNLANEYAGRVRSMPERLTHLLKVLRRSHIKAEESADDTISAECNLYIKGIDRFQSMKIPLYFAASQLFPQEFKDVEDDTSKALLNILKPGLFGSLLTLVWYYRRAYKYASPELRQ